MMVPETTAELPDFWNTRGFCTHLLDLKEFETSSKPVCTVCTWYGALWWPLLWEAYLAPQTWPMVITSAPLRVPSQEKKL